MPFPETEQCCWQPFQLQRSAHRDDPRSIGIVDLTNHLAGVSIEHIHSSQLVQRVAGELGVWIATYHNEVIARMPRCLIRKQSHGELRERDRAQRRHNPDNQHWEQLLLYPPPTAGGTVLHWELQQWKYPPTSVVSWPEIRPLLICRQLLAPSILLLDLTHLNRCEVLKLPMWMWNQMLWLGPVWRWVNPDFIVLVCAQKLGTMCWAKVS